MTLHEELSFTEPQGSAMLKQLSEIVTVEAGQLVAFAISAVEAIDDAPHLIKAQWTNADACQMLRLASILHGIATEIVND